MKAFVRWSLTMIPFLYMILIWVLSSLPDTAVIELPDDAFDRFFKESLHVIEFGILYSFFILALLAHDRLTYTANLFVALVAAFYGLVDEIHQSFIPYRSATIIDAVKDLIGVGISFWIVNRTYFTRPSHFLTRGMKWLTGVIMKKEGA
ncbi:VanZ family protein [Bacillus pakistanensis]|uniref:VanZ family protein n=1 Tax=Rossellomorea pakistanensis TaxID=992288 RepID=A0ABS2NBN2_9BACI|nr:VanZ family protein [Bacillus pakistanensis]MBM7585277.1 VanZ family protein [Bacillus pakistanensis]